MRTFIKNWVGFVTIIVAGVAQARTVRIIATTADSHQPVAGVNVTFESESSETKGVTGEDGVATFTVSEPTDAKVTLKKPGWVTVEAYWNAKRLGEPPLENWPFAMERGTRIGGRVVDVAGRPLAGAHVMLRVRTAADGWFYGVRPDASDVVTDADGRWHTAGVPAACKSIDIAVWHQDCLPEEGYYDDKPFEPQQQLRDETALVTLRRGTPLCGVVRGLDGQPVEGAKVYYNPERRVSNCFPPAKTDAAGTFALGVPPGTTATLVVEHPGFAPTRQLVRVKAEPLTTDLTLRPPAVLSGRVIDRAGKGIAGAHVWVHDWAGRDTLNETLTTGPDGAFTWADAPPESVRVDVYGTNLVGARDAELKAGDKNEVQVAAVTPVAVSVLDAQTGQPVKGFEVRRFVAWSDGRRTAWTFSNPDDRPIVTDTGFTYLIGQPADQYVFRVEADGYYAAETPAFPPDGQLKTFKLRLDHGTPLSGRATLPSSKSAGPGKVYFVENTISISDGDIVDEATVTADVDTDGRFILRPQRSKGGLLIIAANGMGRWNPGDWESRTQFLLQPWAKVGGRIMVGDKPLAEATSLSGIEFVDEPETPPIVRWSYDIHTDADGRFTLDHVWPGRIVVREFTTNRKPRRGWNLNLGAFDAVAGKTTTVQLGGTGRPVVGKLAMQFGATPWMLRICEAKSTTDPKAMPLSPMVGDDGQLRIEDAPPGEYALHVALHEWPPGDDCGWGRVLGEYKTTFTVPTVASGGLGAPVDLGTLASVVSPGSTLHAGDPAPDFTVKTLDGKTARFGDFKGKIVLLDFWATWCAPCVAEMPNMKKLYDAHRGDDRLVIVGMNADEADDITNLRQYLNAQHYDWPQALLGTDSVVAEAYGATAIPATILIGPDGKVIARDLRGDALREAVERALQ